MEKTIKVADKATVDELIQKVNGLSGTATSSKSGLMSPGDKAKLDGIETGAQKNVAVTLQSLGAAADHNHDGTYAKRSIYDNTAMSLGRKSDTTIGYLSMTSGSNSVASGNSSVALGQVATAEKWNSVAIGNGATASGERATAIGTSVTAEGERAIAMGYFAKSTGKSAISLGEQVNSSNYASLAVGRCNKTMAGGGDYNNQTGDLFVIGNGLFYERKPSNALRVTYTGEVLGTKAFNSSGADYAEFIRPWHDNNAGSEDRVGYFVTVKNGLLYKAEAGDHIYGITSGNPSVVGNADEDYYWRYERDAFNRIVMEDVPELAQKKDGEGNLLYDEETNEPIMEETGRIIPNARMKYAKNYDSDKQDGYVERKNRTEWDYVGMVGVLPVRDDGTCLPDHLCRCGKGGTATFAPERGFDTYMVIERISDNIVSVLLK